MTETNGSFDPNLYEDSSDFDTVRCGKEYTAKDIEKFLCVRNFIHAAYSNVVLAVVKILRENGVSDEQLAQLEFHHGQEDGGDNHSETLEQFWSLRVVMHNESNCWYRLWFPCKLFWMPRSVILEWFNGEDEGYPQILAFKEWMSRV